MVFFWRDALKPKSSFDFREPGRSEEMELITGVNILCL